MLVTRVQYNLGLHQKESTARLTIAFPTIEHIALQCLTLHQTTRGIFLSLHVSSEKHLI